MSVSAPEAVGPGEQLPFATATASGAADKEMFLQLLVAQLRYQDPMNPTDATQFLTQSAQFTALEKMQDVADRTAELVSAQLAFGASGLVGRTVTYGVTDGEPVTGTVRGVTFGVDGPVLDVDGTEVPIAQLLSVTDGSTPTVPAAPAD